MKRFSFISAFIALAIVLLSHTMPVKSNGIVGYSGATGRDCSSCHGGKGTGNVSLISNIPTTGYVPGATYNMTLTVADPGKSVFGVDLSVTGGGTLSAGAGTQLKSGEIVHSGGGSTIGTFSFNWTAPTTGNVTFNFAGLAANGDGNDDIGDLTYTGSKIFAPQTAATLSASTTITSVSCFGGTNGSAMVTATGGTTYTYLWSNGQTTPTINNLAVGTYTVTVTSGSQTTTSIAIITQPTQIVGMINTPSVITCTTPSSTIIASASGGVPPYSYSWTTAATSATISVSTAGNYSVSITDSKGCMTSKTATVSGSCVTIPCSIPLTVAPANVTIENSVCGINCTSNGGKIIAPTNACPTGSTLQYSVNGGVWTASLPIYEQVGIGQSIRTRCSCDNDPAVVSPTSTVVVTVPAACNNPMNPPILSIINNVLPSLEGNISASGCGLGNVI